MVENLNKRFVTAVSEYAQDKLLRTGDEAGFEKLESMLVEVARQARRRNAILEGVAMDLRDIRDHNKDSTEPLESLYKCLASRLYDLLKLEEIDE